MPKQGKHKKIKQVFYLGDPVLILMASRDIAYIQRVYKRHEGKLGYYRQLVARKDIRDGKGRFA